MTLATLLIVLGVLVYLVFIAKKMSKAISSISENLDARFVEMLYPVFTEKDVRSMKDEAIRETKKLLERRVRLYDSPGWKTRPEPEEIKEKAWHPDRPTADAMKDIVWSTYFAQRAWFFHCALADANRQVALGRKSREEVMREVWELEESEGYMGAERAINSTFKNWLRSEAGEEVYDYPDSRWCLRTWSLLARSLERELYPGREFPVIWPSDPVVSQGEAEKGE